MNMRCLTIYLDLQFLSAMFCDFQDTGWLINPRYFFKAIINESDFLISFLNHSLLVCRNTTDFLYWSCKLQLCHIHLLALVAFLDSLNFLYRHTMDMLPVRFQSTIQLSKYCSKGSHISFLVSHAYIKGLHYSVVY